MTESLVRVRFGGLGGQGLVTMGAVLAEAGAMAGKRVAASQSYGSRARGGATRSDVILSDEYIDFPHVHHADLLVVLAQEAYELYLPSLAEGALVMVDDFFVDLNEQLPASQCAIPGVKTAMDDLGNKQAANFVMLGALIGHTQLIDRAVVERAIESVVRARFLDVNLRAFGLGIGLGEALSQGGMSPWP